VESLALFGLTASLGSTESLAMPPQFLRSRDFTPEQQLACGVGETTVRLSLGIEAAEDLLADLEQALAAAYA
ncbi:MAG: PLP-dependent transferase, partial [Pseudomonadota bacterium]